MSPALPEGTPDDWWDLAEEITGAEALERNLGDWYITKVRTAGDTKPNYRLSTPSKPANQANLLKLLKQGHGAPDERVRCIVRAGVAPQPWVTSTFVQADLEEGAPTEQRTIWVRKRSGRWHCLTDGRKNINDHAMAQLRPVPATFTVEEGLI